MVSSSSPPPDIGQTREHENLFLQNYFNPPPEKSGFSFSSSAAAEAEEHEEGENTAEVEGDSEAESIVCLGEVSSAADPELDMTRVNQEETDPVERVSDSRKAFRELPDMMSAS